MLLNVRNSNNKRVHDAIIDTSIVFLTLNNVSKHLIRALLPVN